MTPEAKKKLEEMAHNQLVEKLVMTNVDENYFTAMFMAGAQAAWEMATVAERERICQILYDSTTLLDNESVAKIVNPETP